MKHTKALFALAVTLTAGLLAAQAQDAPKRVGDPYPLATCPVTGRPVAEASTITADGREVKFCCPTCVGTFNADPKVYLDKLDAAIIEDQMKVYPRKATCVVMTEEELSDPLGADADDAKPLVVGNRLFRICCKKCIAKIKKDPERFLADLDAQVVAAQKADYPLTTCVVSGEALDEGAYEFVVANRLVRVCCKKCAEKVRANPLDAITKVDAARAAKAAPSKSASAN